MLTATEQRAAERGDYPREMLDVLDAVAECASGADVVRWWGQTAHVVEALGAHAKAAKLIVSAKASVESGARAVLASSGLGRAVCRNGAGVQSAGWLSLGGDVRPPERSEQRERAGG